MNLSGSAACTCDDAAVLAAAAAACAAQPIPSECRKIGRGWWLGLDSRSSSGAAGAAAGPGPRAGISAHVAAAAAVRAGSVAAGGGPLAVIWAMCFCSMAPVISTIGAQTTGVGTALTVNFTVTNNPTSVVSSVSTKEF